MAVERSGESGAETSITSRTEGVHRHYGLVRLPNASTQVEDAMRRCECCGDSTAVATYTRWLGGHGHVLVDECANKPACWARQDERMGLVTPEQQNSLAVTSNQAA